MRDPEAVLRRYFQALRDCDWQALRDCVAPDVHRSGPFQDVVEGRDAYADFLAGVVPRLRGYELRVRDLKRVEGGGVWVRLSEFVEVDGVATEHPEALLFEFDDAGRVARVDVYLKSPPRST